MSEVDWTIRLAGRNLGPGGPVHVRHHPGERHPPELSPRDLGPRAKRPASAACTCTRRSPGARPASSSGSTRVTPSAVAPPTRRSRTSRSPSVPVPSPTQPGAPASSRRPPSPTPCRSCRTSSTGSPSASSCSAHRPTTSRVPSAASPTSPRAEGVDPEAKLYDLLIANDGADLLLLPALNYSNGDSEVTRDAPAPGGRARALRRRCALRHDLRQRRSPRGCSRTGPTTVTVANVCRSSSWCSARPSTRRSTASTTVACSPWASVPTSTSSTTRTSRCTRHATPTTYPQAVAGSSRTPRATWPPSSTA